MDRCLDRAGQENPRGVRRARGRVHDKVDAKNVEFNVWLTDLAKSAYEGGQKLKSFKDEVREHYVRTDDLNKVENGLQTSVSELREDVRGVNGTVEDVRDVMNRMEAKLVPDKPSELAPRRSSRTSRPKTA